MAAFPQVPQMFQNMNLTRLAAPVLVLLVLAMMILPLPPLLLDILFIFNMALSVIVLLVALNTVKPLDFSVFPTMLLVTTLMRLSLNVASSRLILLEGHTGADAAGKVIEAFGHFLVGGNFAVGVVVFLILLIINFIVITKGAGRIAEVSARFTLDAMPGKQMAIDADLNAGLIGEDEARKRRETIAQEADFFGSMDGASKFVRGDAIAAIIIIVLNLVVGLAIGMVSHNLDFATAVNNYTLLTIGDGLVAQVPALIISTAAGLVVSRVGSDQDLSSQFIDQLFGKSQPLYVAAGVMMALGVLPGMPFTRFGLMALMMAGIAFGMDYLKKSRSTAAAESAAPPPPPPPEAIEVSWDDVAPVDMIGLEVGYRLIPLVDRNQDGELLRRIRGIRKKIAQDMGFLVPAVHIRDNLELRPNAYSLLLKGVAVAQGEAFTGMYLAINPGRVMGDLPGNATTDPAFGLPAVWIDADTRELAQGLGYTVVDSATVVATHLSNVIQTHAAELLGRDEVQQLLNHVSKDSPKLVEELVPKLLPLSVVQKVLQSLLEEDVHIRDMRTILATLIEHAPTMQDPDALTTEVRRALGRTIIHDIFQGQNELPVIALDPGLERILTQAAQSKSENAGLEPGLADTLLRDADRLVQRQEEVGMPAVLMVPPAIRTLLSRFLRRAIPTLKVISHNEIPDNKTIRVVSVLGGRA